MSLLRRQSAAPGGAYLPPGCTAGRCCLRSWASRERTSERMRLRSKAAATGARARCASAADCWGAAARRTEVTDVAGRHLLLGLVHYVLCLGRLRQPPLLVRVVLVARALAPLLPALRRAILVGGALRARRSTRCQHRCGPAGGAAARRRGRPAAARRRRGGGILAHLRAHQCEAAHPRLRRVLGLLGRCVHEVAVDLAVGLAGRDIAHEILLVHKCLQGDLVAARDDSGARPSIPQTACSRGLALLPSGPPRVDGRWHRSGRGSLGAAAWALRPGRCGMGAAAAAGGPLPGAVLP
jgi:hypothetical protein